MNPIIIIDYMVNDWLVDEIVKLQSFQISIKKKGSSNKTSNKFNIIGNMHNSTNLINSICESLNEK